MSLLLYFLRLIKTRVRPYSHHVVWGETFPRRTYYINPIFIYCFHVVLTYKDTQGKYERQIKYLLKHQNQNCNILFSLVIVGVFIKLCVCSKVTFKILEKSRFSI